jgi:glycosyltransferase involved in cell wall biosynthesis
MAHKPIRIIYVDTGTDMAGGQYSLLTLLKRLDRSKYVPILFAPSRSRLREMCKDLGVETHMLPFRSVHMESHMKPFVVAWLEDMVRSAIGVFFLAWAIGRKHGDAVHANTFKAALVGSIACLLARRPLIFHDRITIRHGVLGKLVARRARRIIVVSSALAGTHGQALRGKVSLIYDGIDTDYMSPEKVMSGTGRDGQATVCYLGRISWEKGVDVLVQAAALVVAKVPRTRFLVGGSPHTPGDASYGRKIRGLAQDLHVTGSLDFLGAVEDTRAFLMRADIVVLPSRRESLGLVLLEAMSLEKPVVAFDIDGPREIITDGKDGLLVKPGDVQALAEAIMSVLGDQALAGRLGKAGRETVISRFSARTFADRISEIYDEIASRSVEV